MKDIDIKLQEGLLSGIDDVSSKIDDTINVDAINKQLLGRDSKHSSLHPSEEDSDFWKWFKVNQNKLNDNASSNDFAISPGYGELNDTHISYSDTQDGYQFFTASALYIGDNTKKEMLKFFGNTGVDVVKAGSGVLIDVKNINKDTMFKKVLNMPKSSWQTTGVYIQDVRNIDGLNIEIGQGIGTRVVIDSFYPKISIKDTSIKFLVPDHSSKILFKTPSIPDISQLFSNCHSLGFFDEDIFESKNNPFEKLFDWDFKWIDPKTNKEVKINSFMALRRIINQVRSTKATRQAAHDKIERNYHYNLSRYQEKMAELGTYDPSIPIVLKDRVKLSDCFSLNTVPDVQDILISDKDMTVVITKTKTVITDGVKLLYIGETADGWRVGVGSDKGKSKYTFGNW